MIRLFLYAALVALLGCGSYATRSLSSAAVKDIQKLEATDLGVASVINDGFDTVVKSFSKCAELCLETEGCLSFTFHKKGAGSFKKGNCFLLDIIPISKNSRTTDSGVVPPRVDNPVECNSEPGIFFLGDIVVDGNLLQATSGSECCLRCQENPDCMAYTWLAEGACILKSEISGKVECEDCESGIPGQEDNEAVVVVLDDPQVPGGGEWDEIRTGTLSIPVKTAWEQMKDPVEALKNSFRHLEYSVFREEDDGPIVVELTTGEEMTFDVVATNLEQRYHVFEIDAQTDALLQIPPDSVEFVGSFAYMHLVPSTGSGNARVSWGFHEEISPPELVQTAKFFFGEFMDVMIENLKLTFGSGDCLHDPTVRNPQGSCNNPDNLGQGGAFTPFRRLQKNDPSFEDGETSPSGSTISARAISNAVSVEAEDSAGGNSKAITEALAVFGEFVAHDLYYNPRFDLISGPVPFFTLSRERFQESLPIEVPADDPVFTGEFATETIDYNRGAWRRLNNTDSIPREYLNQVTSYLDLGPLYGGNNVRAVALRTFEKGLLKTGVDGFLPLNGRGDGGIGINLDNVPNAGNEFYVTGDVRANSNAELLAMHALWLKEHNQVAEELDEASGGDLSDGELFEYAKEIVIAEYQSIIYNEFLPMVLCPGAVPADDWRYSLDVDASVDLFFATVSSRFLQSMYAPSMWLLSKNSEFPPEDPTEEMEPRGTFNKPAGDVISTDNFDEWVLGMMWRPAAEVDTKVVEDYRSFLATDDPEVPTSDQVALNIQQARDFGLPMYNDAREAFGLDRAKHFFDLTSGKKALSNGLKGVYGDVDLVDPFIGGLAEKPSDSCRLVGDLFYESIKDTFQRARDGDRLFYKGFTFTQMLVDIYPRLDRILRDEVQLADIVVRNSGVTFRMLGGSDRDSIFAMES